MIKRASYWSRFDNSPTECLPSVAEILRYKDAGFTAINIAEITYNNAKQNFADIFAGANGWTRSSNPIVTCINNIHAAGLKAYFVHNSNRYGGNTNILTRPADKAAFVAAFDYLITLPLDGLELEEPNFWWDLVQVNGVWTPKPNADHIAQSTAFFQQLKAKVPALIRYGFNTSSKTVDGNLSRGIDLAAINSQRLFNYVASQPGKGPAPDYLITNDIILGAYNLFRGFMPNLATEVVIYKSYSIATGTKINSNLITNAQTVVNNNIDFELFPASSLIYPVDYDALKLVLASIVTALDIRSTPAGASIKIRNNGNNLGWGNYGTTPRIKELPPGNYSVQLTFQDGTIWTSDPINLVLGQTVVVENTSIPTRYVLKFRDDFNSLSGWDIIWKNPSVFKVANSILTIDIPAGSTTPAWMRKTGFTWKYGKLSFRAKFPNATGSHAGVWGYKNNGVPCSNNPTLQSQDSVNIETNISKDTYGPRIAGHLTTTYSMWSAAICNKYMIEDTPYDGNNFHEYEIEWTPVAVVFKKDGVEMKRFTAGIPTQALDLNAGIDCVGSTGSACAGIQWMDKTPSYPMKMEIDWIQLEQLEEAGEQLIFEDHFNDAVLTGWQYIKNQSKVSVANSMLTMRGDSAADSPWIMKINPDGTPFTWKYGKLQVRMKVPSASNTRTGFWSYRNNQVQCANNPAILAQDSINLEITKSASSYTDSHGTRVAGHITTAWSTWTTPRCNQYDLWDTPNESLAFHDHEVEWTPSAVIFRKDGVEIKRITDPAMIPSNPINLNIAMAFGVGTGITWMDTTPPVYPVFFQVDSVRLYAAGGATPTTGSIDIQSNPTGAEVYFDNFLKGITPLILDNITPGTHVVEIRKTEYNNLEQSVVITAGQTLTKMYTLQYSCVPDWQCEVINGLKTGYEVDGCGNRRENIECIPKGMLYISTIPVSGAKIYLDNEDTLSFTPAILLVSPGIPHTIRVFVPGYNEFIESNIIVSDNQTISKIYTLFSSSRDSAGTVITVSTGLVVGTTLYGISKLLQR